MAKPLTEVQGVWGVGGEDVTSSAGHALVDDYKMHTGSTAEWEFLDLGAGWELTEISP